jgi:hypothetical protein
MGSGSSKVNNSSAPLSSGNSASLTSYFNVVPYSVALTQYKKYALIIGVNYTGTSISLNGCINDALNMDKLLKDWGFETTVMTDKQSGSLNPTKTNIITQLTSHINKLSANDILVIYYSGHGALTPDVNGDEISGKDSVIVPINAQTQGFINDDWIRSLLNNAVSNSKILGIFDCCNSGSVCDLRYNYFDTSYRSNPGDKNSQLIQRTKTITNNNYIETDAHILSLSGCKDDQLSYETVLDNGKAGGALTYCLLKHIYENTPDITIEQLLLQVRGMLKSYRFNQVPSLMSGKLLEPLNVNLASFLNIKDEMA